MSGSTGWRPLEPASRRRIVEKQKQFISTLFTQLEAAKNGAGDDPFSSAVVRSIFANFFQDLKKVRQSPSSRSLGRTFYIPSRIRVYL